MRLNAAIFCIIFVFAAAAPAQDAAQKPFQLTGPDVTKLDWNTRGLNAADIDGDGRTDLALLNNDRARIELLYQLEPGQEMKATKRVLARERWEPLLEDARLQKVAVVTGIQMFDLAVGDLNGDGRADLAYTGRPDALTVRYQDADEQWTEKRVFDLDEPLQWENTMLIADINGDQRNDLIVMTAKRLAVFIQNEDHRLEGPTQYAMSDPNGLDLKLIDVNSDGVGDLMYLNPTATHPLRVRFGLSRDAAAGDEKNSGGGFGAERIFDIQAPGSFMRPIRISAPGGAPGKSPALTYVHKQSGLIELLRLEPQAHDEKEIVLRSLSPLVFATTASPIPSSYAFGDFDGDKRMDIAVGQAESAAVLVYFQKKPGEVSEPSRFPSLSDIRSIAAADFDGDGTSELVVVSPREKVLGLSKYVEPGRLGYPTPLPLTYKPLAVAAGDLDGDGKAEIVALSEENRKRYLSVLRRKGGEGDDAKPQWQVDHTELAVRVDPSELRLLDANQDGRLDVAIFTAGEPMRLLVQNAEGKFAEPPPEPPGAGAPPLLAAPGGASTAGGSGGAAMIDRLTAAAFTVGDVDSDGKSEMLIAPGGGAFARSLRLDDRGRLHVIDQYNAQHPDARLAAAVAVDLDGDKAAEIVLLDQKTSTLQLLRRDDAGVYRFADSAPIGKIDLVAARVMDFDGDGRDDLMLLGNDRFWWISTTASGFAARSLSTYESDLQDVSYTTLAVGDLNGDGREDLIAIDARQSNVLEVLRVDDEGRLTSAMHFTVYEKDPFYQGRAGGGGGGEPRQVLIADLTGDKKDDIVLLIHDRLLVYPQK